MDSEIIFSVCERSVTSHIKAGSTLFLVANQFCDGWFLPTNSYTGNARLHLASYLEVSLYNSDYSIVYACLF